MATMVNNFLDINDFFERRVKRAKYGVSDYTLLPEISKLIYQSSSEVPDPLCLDNAVAFANGEDKKVSMFNKINTIRIA